MFTESLFAKNVHLSTFLSKRYLRGRSSSVIKTPNPKSLVNDSGNENDAEISTSVFCENWDTATEWRKQEEVRFARRLLPVPVSLTGFGDGDKPRFWRNQLTNALVKLQDDQKQESLCLRDKLSPSLKLFFDNNGENVEEEFRKFYQIYEQEKKFDVENDNTRFEKRDTLQLPFNIVEAVKGNGMPVKKHPPQFKNGLIDEEYDTYLKHHHLLQHLATGLTKGVTNEEYEAEIEAWRDEMWRRNYGTPNPAIKPTCIPCGGCGAHLHCVDNSIPGYIPSEVFTGLSENELRSSLCQRCEYLRHFNVALNVNVASEEYPKIISEIRNKYALVILMVDLIDFPCSIWPKILDLIGHKRKIYVVGNKVDLLPKDSSGYLERIEHSLRNSLHVTRADQKVNIKHLCLISAKTGYGVEALITKLFQDWNGKGDIILVGSTNVGKSTLFNALMQSDLCKAREYDLMQRATTSIWPGTTLNLLKFPINRIEGWKLKLRFEKMVIKERVKANERDIQRSLRRQVTNPGHLVLSDRMGTIFRDEVPFNLETGHPFSRKKTARKPFDANDKAFKNCHFFYDTPGAVYKEQLLTLLTTEELLKTIPREVITPRTFSMRPFQSLFVGGIGRIDVIHAMDSLLLTVFASHYLPIHVVSIEDARRFYDVYLGTDMLVVPQGDAERLKQWPPLIPTEIDLCGIGSEESCADIVLSSAGWVAVTLKQGSKCVLKAFTPEGRGLYIRQPSVLPFAVKLRGKRIQGTPCFETHKAHLEEDDNDYKYFSSFHRM